MKRKGYYGRSSEHSLNAHGIKTRRDGHGFDSYDDYEYKHRIISFYMRKNKIIEHNTECNWKDFNFDYNGNKPLYTYMWQERIFEKRTPFTKEDKKIINQEMEKVYSEE